MSENFGTNDDRRRLYGSELCVECNKYCRAINDTYDLCKNVIFEDLSMCILTEVLDLENDESPSDEGIEKGEYHKRDRVRFASGVFKAFFDEKIIDEKIYDQLFKNLREEISKDYLGPHQEVVKQREEIAKLAKEERRLYEIWLGQGVKLRSGKVLPSNDKESV